MISFANQIEFRHLRYFQVLADTLHYGKAAEQLSISQSALSQQIKQLEQLLGQSLFERTNKRVALSEAGKVLYQEAGQVLTRMGQAIHRLALLKDGNIGELGIGFVASAMHSVLPPLLKRYNKDRPQIKLSLEELTNQEQMAALQDGRIDIGYMRSNQVGAEMRVQLVFREHFALVLPAAHRITARTFRDMSQLKDEPFILFPNEQSQSYYQQIINLCAASGFFPAIAHKSIHAPTIFKLVEQGMGVSVIPMSLAVKDHPRIRFIELKDVPQQTELYAVWRKHNDNPALGYWLERMG